MRDMARRLCGNGAAMGCYLEVAKTRSAHAGAAPDSRGGEGGSPDNQKDGTETRRFAGADFERLAKLGRRGFQTAPADCPAR